VTTTTDLTRARVYTEKFWGATHWMVWIPPLGANCYEGGDEKEGAVLESFGDNGSFKTWEEACEFAAQVTAIHPPVVEYSCDEFAAAIRPYGGGGFVLEWHDHVTGQWAEWYRSLAVAVCRLGAIIDCVTVDGAFDADAYQFQQRCDEMFADTNMTIDRRPR
jgi:hypothetical protein